MKIAFYLLGEKAFQSLERFIDQYGTNNIGYIVIGKDKNIAKDYYEEMKQLADLYNLNTYERNDSIEFKVNYSFSIGWRWLINSSNLIVFHDSLLPKYRGFSPLVNMLINGEEWLGVTALFAVNEYDKGAIIKQERVPIEYPIKIQQAIELVTSLYVELVLSISNLILKGEKLPYLEQEESESTYSLWRDEEDYEIDWTRESSEILRFIDAVGYPFKGASTYLNGDKVRIVTANIFNDVTIESRLSHVGKIIFMKDNFPVVVCGKGLLQLQNIKDDKTGNKVNEISFRSRFI